jgi:hypothetical protein
MTSFAQQVPDRSIRFWIDIAFGQYAKSHHFCQPEGIMPIIVILEPGVFLYGVGSCEMNPISLGHQQINQPVPVIRRLDGYIVISFLREAPILLKNAIDKVEGFRYYQTERSVCRYRE